MIKQKTLDKAIEELCLAEGHLFSEAFDNRPDRARFLVEPVLHYLGYKDFKILSVKTEKTHNNLYQHGTRSDIEIELKSGEVVLIEIQMTHPERFPPKRARYISSSYDVNSLKQGEDYESLPTQIQIIISKEDLIGTERPIEVFRMRSEDTNVVLPDGKTLVYINQESQSEGNEEIDILRNDILEKDYRKVKSSIAREILETYKKPGENRMQLQGVLREAFEEENKDLLRENENNIQKIEEYAQKIESYLKRIQDLEEAQKREREEFRHQLDIKEKEIEELRKIVHFQD